MHDSSCLFQNMYVFVFMYAESFQSCTLCDPMDHSTPAPLSMGFSRQESWSGLPCPPPGDLPSPGMEPESPALMGGFFTTGATWEAHVCLHTHLKIVQ